MQRAIFGSNVRRTLAAGVALTALLLTAGGASAGGYQVKPLVTDNQSVLAGLGYGAAPTTDPALVNPWDIASSGTGPYVVANTGGNGSGLVAGTATTYTATGQKIGATITIPQAVGPAQGGQTGPAGPTGVVYSGGTGFTTPGGGGAQYIFDNLDGSISAWDGSSAAAQTVIPGRGPGGNLAAYTGLEIGSVGNQTYLYGANNITGNIDVFNTAYAPVSLAGNFVDPGANPDGLLPFNIQQVDGHMWVTYAEAGPPSASAPLGSGFVSEFNMDGTFVRRFATGGMLDSPWGVAIAPADFGAYSNDVLIGNFNDDGGEGFINAFDPNTGAYLGQLEEGGKPIVLPGLWGIQFGGGGQSGPTNELFFAAGIGDENHGLFGGISAVPEPSAWLMMMAGFALLGARMRVSADTRGRRSAAVGA